MFRFDSAELALKSGRSVASMAPGEEARPRPSVTEERGRVRKLQVVCPLFLPRESVSQSKSKAESLKFIRIIKNSVIEDCLIIISIIRKNGLWNCEIFLYSIIVYRLLV